MKGPYKLNQKSRIFNNCILPTLTYASQTWTLSNKIQNRIKTTQNSLERSILGIKLRDKINLRKVKKILKNNTDALTEIRRKIWDWAGHVARLKDDRWTREINVWLPRVNRKRGRQKARWRDPITHFLENKNYESVAIDRIEWHRLRETFAQCNGP